MASSTISRRISEFAGVALFGCALLWVISLASYSASDPVWFFNTGSELAPANFAGRIGAFLAELSYQLLGYAAYVIPLVLVVIGWHYFWCRTLDAVYTKLAGAALLFGCMSSFLSLAFGTVELSGKEFRAGGLVGERLAALLSEYLNRTGSIVLILTLLFLAIILSTQFSFGRLFSAVFQMVRDRAAVFAASLRERREERRREKQRQEVLKKHLSKQPKDGRDAADSREAREPGDLKDARPRPTVTPSPALEGAATARGAAADDRQAEPRKPSKTAAMVSAAAAALRVAASKPTPAPPIKRPPPTPVEASLPLSEPDKVPAERRKGTFTLPPNALLDAPRAERKIDERELMDGARLLEDKCREFSVEGDRGPDPSRSRRHDLRVQARRWREIQQDHRPGRRPVPGHAGRIRPDRSHPGQIDGRHPDSQPESRADLPARAARVGSVQALASKLTLALGKTIHGEPFLSDLATMPHLLIAGSTGTGKSVSVNAMLTSILFRATPDDVRFIMIDPKRLELGMYEDIPHLLTPVVVDPKLAANAMRWAVREMEDRYKTLAAVGVRNIDQYNRNIRAMQAEKKGAPLTDDNGNEIKTLPFIVVLIDELADLMMVAGNEVEESIARLAQMARAVGIHLILATQRPSVDVITGLIKANLPARISFRVSSKIDSRTILDGNGAEQLLGKGDMLYLPPASSRFVRLHGPYISEQESARLASFLRKQGKPVYNTTITDEEKGGPEAIEFERDELYEEAVAHRRLERSGVDLVPAASPQNRLQPRGPARRHDGSGWPRVGRRRRQAARGAGQEGLLRRSGCTTSIGVTYETAILVRARPGPPGGGGASGAGSRCGAHALHSRARPGTNGPRPVKRRDRSRHPTVVRAYEQIVRRYPTSGYSDNALWQAANLAILAADRFGENVDRRTAERLLKALTHRLSEQQPGSAGAADAAGSRPRAGDGDGGRGRRYSPIRAAGSATTNRDPARAAVSTPVKPVASGGERVPERDSSDDAARRRADHPRPRVGGGVSPGRSRTAPSRLLRSEERPIGHWSPGRDVEIRGRRA